MKTKVHYIPEGLHTITPLMTVNYAARVIDFLKKVFDAEELYRMDAPDGKLMHAEVQVGDSRIMLGEASGEWKPFPASLYLYVEDVDATYQKALDAGANSIMPPADMFWGDRYSEVQDESGNRWCIATHIEDVSPEEMTRRGAEWMRQQKK